MNETNNIQLSTVESALEEPMAVRELVDQLNKDFIGAGLDIVLGLPDGNPLQTLREWVADILFELVEKNRERYMAFLYRVDIPDTVSKQVHGAQEVADVMQTMADLILVREYQKVQLRKRFSS